MKTLIAIVLFVALLWINDYFILSKIQKERTERVLQLTEQMKNLQSRININVSKISNLEHIIQQK